MSYLDSSSALQPIPRRTFFRVAGATAATSALLLAGCNDDSSTTPEPATGKPALLFDSKTSDVNVLNYLYVLVQLELALYETVVKAFPGDMPADERAAFTDLRDHELIHSEFFKYIIGSEAKAGLTFDFGSLTLNTRAGVLAAARQLEDLGVAAYTDACKRVSSADYILMLAKIASVEARHAAYVRDLLEPNSFAASDVVVSLGSFGGFGDSKTPTEVAEALAPYFTVTLVTSNFA